MADDKKKQGWGASLSQVIETKNEKGGFRNYLKSLMGMGRQQATVMVSSTRQTIPEMEFASYISNVGESIGKMKKQLSRDFEKKKKKEVQLSVEETVRSIPGVYFQKDRGLQMGKLKTRIEIKKQQQKLADYLDVVDVCLFRQINTKFSDFFSILDNIQYLENAVNINIIILAQARKSLSIVQAACVKKVASIKKKHTILANRKKLQAIIMLLKEVRDSQYYAEVEHTNETMAALCSAKSSYYSIKQLKSVDRIGKWLDSKTNQLTESFSKGVYIRLMLYVIEPLRQDIPKLFKSIPQENKDINETLILNQTRLQPQKQIVLTVDPRVEKQTGKILGQMHNSLGIKEVQEVWSQFIRGLEHLYVKFLDDLRMFLATTVSKEKEQVLVQSDQNIEINTPLQQLLDKVPLSLFSRLLLVLHNFLTTSLLRYYGLLNHFMQQILKQGINQPQLFTWMVGCAQEMIYKMRHTAFSLISLRKMADDTILTQFHSHLQQNMVWQDCLKKILEMKLFSEEYCNASQNIEKLKIKIIDILQHFTNSKKNQQLAFINNIHDIVVESQLRQTLRDETWTAVNNIPFHYMPTIYYILFGDLNEVTLNDSVMDRSRREMSILVDSKRKADSYRGNDFKLLKNAVIINKKPYRVTVCALLFTQVLEEYLKIQDLYPQFKEEIAKKIQEVITVYNQVSYEMIVMGGALKLDKIKAKIITARHLCLSWSCLQFIMILLEKHENTSRKMLQSHSMEIKKRLATLIKGKINMEIQNLLKSPLKSHPCPIVHTVNIISSYRQMLQIMQDHMPQAICRQILKQSVDMMTNMVTELRKSQRGTQQALFFISDMKILEQSFPDQYKRMKCI